MHRTAKTLPGTVLALWAVLGLVNGSARAQFSYVPGQNVNAASQQAVLYNQAAAANTAFRYSQPPVAYGSNPYVTFQSPVAGYLQGAADVTNANGQYQIQIQQARLMREQSRQAASDTRRKLFDERRYEQANTPSLQDQLDAERRMREREARDNPQLTTILAGDTLNVLLNQAVRAQGQGIYGPRIPLNQELLPQIHVTAPGTGGNPGMLQPGGKLDWPLVLDDKEYEGDRTLIDGLFRKAVDQAGSYGKVQSDTLRALIKARDKLEQRVVDNVANLTPTEFVQGKRYCRELKAGIRTLQDPNVARYLSKTWSAQGETAADLVRFMATNGLQFAPATASDDAAYKSLYTALAAYGTALYELARR